MEELFHKFDREPNFPIYVEPKNAIKHTGSLSAIDRYVNREIKKIQH